MAEKCIDISKHQTSYNPEVTKSQGVTSVFCRIAYATSQDTKASTYMQATTNAGLKLGSYGFGTWHYKSVNNNDLNTARSVMKTQVNAWIKMLSNFKITTWFGIDQELERNQAMGLSIGDNTTLLIEAAKMLESAGYKVCLYASASWIKSYVNLNAFNYPLWVAYYRWYGTAKNFDNVSEQFPGNSGTWGVWMNTYKSKICMWQFTSEGYADMYGTKHGSNGLDKNWLYSHPSTTQTSTTTKEETTTSPSTGDVQQFIFPMKYLRVTQGYGIATEGVAANTYSHLGTNAIDVAGKDTGKDLLYAPFDCVVKRIYNGTAASSKCNFTWYESLNPVKRRDGKTTYLTIQVAHCNNADMDSIGVKVGAVFKQGQVFAKEGNAGCSAYHSHIAVSEGKFTGTGWTKQSSGNYCVNNPLFINQVSWLPNDCVVMATGGYSWVMLSGSSTTSKTPTTADTTTTTSSVVYFKKYTGTSGSIVAALNAIGENSSFAYRSTIAATNNIKLYTGLPSQNTKMLSMLKEGTLIKSKSAVATTSYYAKYTGTSSSIVAALNAIGVDSSFSNRTKIAKVNGYPSNYTGTAAQNTALLNLLKAGKLVKP